MAKTTKSTEPEVVQGEVVAEGAGTALAPTNGGTDITQLLMKALEKDASVDTMERLVALEERLSKRTAAKEFADALAKFQQACPPVPKKSKADFSAAGSRVQYSYAELPDMAAHIAPHLHPLGLSYTWDSTHDENTMTTVCTLRHVNGHSESSTFSAPLESRAGMSPQQKYGSAGAYGRRQSLVQVLGLTTADPDDDAPTTETITESQAADLQALADEVGVDEKKFFVYMGVGDYSEIRAADHRKAVVALESKREQS
jgi:hypothetical protein